MPGFLLHEGAKVLCFHAGTAKPAATTDRVTVGGQPVATQQSTYSISGCTLPPSAGGPCASAKWVNGSPRIRAGGVPVLLSDSQAVCTPTGTGLKVVTTQVRAKGR